MLMQMLPAAMQTGIPTKETQRCRKEIFALNTETQKKRSTKQKSSGAELHKRRQHQLNKAERRKIYVFPPSADVLTSLVAASAFVHGHHVREITVANTAEAQPTWPTSLSGQMQTECWCTCSSSLTAQPLQTIPLDKLFQGELSPQKLRAAPSAEAQAALKNPPILPPLCRIGDGKWQDSVIVIFLGTQLLWPVDCWT